MCIVKTTALYEMNTDCVKWTHNTCVDILRELCCLHVYNKNNSVVWNKHTIHMWIYWESYVVYMCIKWQNSHVKRTHTLNVHICREFRCAYMCIQTNTDLWNQHTACVCSLTVPPVSEWTACCSHSVLLQLTLKLWFLLCPYVAFAFWIATLES